MADSPKAIRMPRQKSPIASVRTIGQRSAPHEDLYHYILTLAWWQFFLFVAAAFVLTNVFFAIAYWASPGAIAGARSGSFEDAFFFSVQTIGTIGYGNMSPATFYGHLVVTVEALVGILSVALITGITFSKFARPTARVLFTDKVVVNLRDGVPHLSFRMANWRHNQVVEAQLRVTMLVAEVTAEGERMRRIVDLPLVRDRSSLFIFSWTALHRIDERSPFYGPDALDRLRAVGAELYLSMSGMDETIGQNIHARHSYRLDDIVWNARFADIFSQQPDGTRVIDYTHFHEVIPLGRADGAGPSGV